MKIVSELAHASDMHIFYVTDDKNNKLAVLGVAQRKYDNACALERYIYIPDNMVESWAFVTKEDFLEHLKREAKKAVETSFEMKVWI